MGRTSGHWKTTSGPSLHCRWEEGWVPVCWVQDWPQKESSVKRSHHFYFFLTSLQPLSSLSLYFFKVNGLCLTSEILIKTVESPTTTTAIINHLWLLISKWAHPWIIFFLCPFWHYTPAWICVSTPETPHSFLPSSYINREKIFLFTYFFTIWTIILIYACITFT